MQSFSNALWMFLIDVVFFFISCGRENASPCAWPFTRYGSWPTITIFVSEHAVNPKAPNTSLSRGYTSEATTTTLLLDAPLETGPIFTLELSPEKVVPVLPEVQPDSSPSESLPLEALGSGPSRSPRNSWSFRMTSCLCRSSRRSRFLLLSAVVCTGIRPRRNLIRPPSRGGPGEPSRT